MGNLYRVLGGDNGHSEPRPDTVPLDVYLDGLENRRDALIMELRGIDRQLVAYGRIKVETLPRRVR